MDQPHDRVLELIASGAPLDEALLAVVRMIEQQSPGALCSVLLAQGGRLRHGVAPSLPAAFNAAVEGLPIAEGSGVCGTAAWRREAVVVSDLSTDKLVEPYRELAAAHGLRSSWSTPVIATSGEVLATFAMYRAEVHQPTSAEEGWVAWATRLVRIAIEHERAIQRVRSSESMLQMAG